MVSGQISWRQALLVLGALALAALAYLTVPTEVPEDKAPLKLVGWALDSGGAASGRYRVEYRLENVGRTDLRLQTVTLLPDLRRSLPAVSAYIDLEGQRRAAEARQDGAYDLSGLTLPASQSLTIGLDLQVVDAAPLKPWREAEPSPPHERLRISYRRYGQPWMTDVKVRYP